jgi:uncharacterized oxidoreductase
VTPATPPAGAAGGDAENRELPVEATRAFLDALFASAGAGPESLRAVVDHLVDASLVGLHSHGVLRAPDYLDAVADGIVDPVAQPRVERDDGATVVLDAARCFGQVAGAHACRVAEERAAAGTCAVVAVRRAGHLGRIGAYVEWLARRGHLAMAFCSVPTRFHDVAWFGTRTGRLGTNPIAYAFPTEAEPVVADFSTSAIPEGKVRFLRNQGLPAPPGVLRDAAGAPTTDPNVLYGDPKGTLQPLGGDQGHKGSALGLLVEAMGTLLAGEDAADPARDNNLTLVAIPVPAGFAALASGLVEHVHAAEPIDPARPPLVPGEPEHRTRAATAAILFDPLTWSRLADHAARLGVDLPAAVAR